MGAVVLTRDYDLAVVGGGLVGTSVSLLLANAGLKTILIEAMPPPSSAPAWDERCIALNDTSRRIFESMQIWEALKAQAAPIRATHISEKGRFGIARFDAAEVGLEALGYNLPLRAIGQALSAQVSRFPIQIECPAKVTDISVEGSHARLTMSVPGRREAKVPAVRARLVIAADGANSSIRALLGIGAQTTDYHQHAIVSAVALARGHHGVAYERFTPEGPMAVIPKPERSASLVWTLPSARAEAMLACTDAQYLAAAHAIFGERLGRFVALGRRFAWPLSRVIVRRAISERVVFIGNAAQSLHPVAAQGFNLGLRDAATLAQSLNGLEDPGDADALREFELARSRDRARTSELTHLMIRAFSNRVPGLAGTRHLGLTAVDLLPGLRQSMLSQHLGYFGLPRAS